MKLILNYFCGLTILLFLSISCNSTTEKAPNEQTQKVIPVVEAVEARYGALPLVERFSATVRSENQVQLFAPISAPIERVFVENGDYVKKGSPLVQLRNIQIKEQLKQAEANLAIALAQMKQAEARRSEVKAQYERTQSLVEKELGSDLELETLSAQYNAAKADVELAKARVLQNKSSVEEQKERLDQAIIRAPFDGTVGNRNAEVGMMATSSMALFTIGDLSNLRLEIILTEDMIRYIERGQTTRIYPQNDDRYVTASVSRISPFLDETSRTTTAQIDVENAQGLLKPGMFAQVDVLYGESEQSTLIPKSALYKNPTSGVEGVYVAKSIGSEIKPAFGEEPSRTPLTEPVTIEFVPLEVIAAGSMDLGVIGINRGSWVVTIGHDLISTTDNQARVRVVTWERVLALQNMQREDLLKSILRSDSNQTL